MSQIAVGSLFAIFLFVIARDQQNDVALALVCMGTALAWLYNGNAERWAFRLGCSAFAAASIALLWGAFF